MTPTVRARLHRFHEFVAFSVSNAAGDTPTTYINAELARKLAHELNRYADDIEGRKFTESSIGSTTLSVSIED